jgi:hypothetical protein
MIAGEGFHPVLVIGGARAQHLLAHRHDPDDLAEEVYHLLGARQVNVTASATNLIEVLVEDLRQPHSSAKQLVLHDGTRL